MQDSLVTDDLLVIRQTGAVLLQYHHVQLVAPDLAQGLGHGPPMLC